MTYDTINDARTIAGNGEGALLANRYRVVRQLGQGGMGSVWLAEDTQLDNKLFAIKMLPAILVSNKRAYRQLKDEALVAMQLVHPNIVQIRAFEENDGNPFLVMDYIDGQTLDDYLADRAIPLGEAAQVGEAASRRFNSAPLGEAASRRFNSAQVGEAASRRFNSAQVGEAASRRFTGTTGVSPVAHGLPESDVLRILRPVAAALDYAHSKGVVHRDVKPGNVMIAKDGTPYILDFGIAREIQETMTRVTGKLSSGTLLYMSPEQLMGESPKPAQDIYSFAAMAYECLKGEPPFVRGAIEDQIKTKQPDPLPAEMLTGKAAILAAGVMSGLAKKPEGRPPTCAAVLEESVFSRKERKERKEAGAVALVATETGGPRPVAALKALLAVVALAVAVTGGWWYYRQEQIREQARVAAEAAEEARQKAVAEEAKRRAEAEEAHQKASANEKKETAENVLVELRKEGALDYGGESFIKIVALHAAGTNAFSGGRYTVANAQFDEMINVVPECKQAIERAQKRAQKKRAKENAEKMKGAADAAEKECGRLNAEIYAEKRSWDAAAKSLKEANEKFAKGDFPAASNAFAVAIRQFEICTNEANVVLKAKEAVVPIHNQALEWQSQLKDISGDDDIESSKNDLTNTFARADTYFSDKERRWSDAAALFTNYVARAKELIELYNERQKGAVAARTKAESAKKRAEKEYAEQFAKESWRDAVERMESANHEFKNKRFVSAANKFNSVAVQFGRCADEAKNNNAVRALLGTWECSMRKEGTTKKMTSCVALSIRDTHITRRTDIDTLFYTFEENGTYILKTEKSYTEYYPEIQLPNGDVDPAKTESNNATFIQEGKWSLQGNVLTLRLLKIDGKPPSELYTEEMLEDKFTVVWSGEHRVELRYADKNEGWETLFVGQINKSCTYLPNGNCRIYTRLKSRIGEGDSSFDLETEINETESSRILRRR